MKDTTINGPVRPKPNESAIHKPQASQRAEAARRGVLLHEANRNDVARWHELRIEQLSKEMQALTTRLSTLRDEANCLRKSHAAMLGKPMPEEEGVPSIAKKKKRKAITNKEVANSVTEVLSANMELSRKELRQYVFDSLKTYRRNGFEMLFGRVLRSDLVEETEGGFRLRTN